MNFFITFLAISHNFEHFCLFFFNFFSFGHRCREGGRLNFFEILLSKFLPVQTIGPIEVRALPVRHCRLQTGCVANIVAAEFIVFFSVFSLSSFFSLLSFLSLLSFSLCLITFLRLRLDLGSV
jgi:hypothetical protein